MKNTLRITPYLDNERPPVCQEFYKIELNIILDGTELEGVAYVTAQLTNCVKQMEYSFELAESSRKLVKDGDKNDK